MNIIVRIETFFKETFCRQEKLIMITDCRTSIYSLKNIDAICTFFYSELSADLSKIIHSFNFIQDFQSNTHYCDSISHRCSDRNIARLSQSKTG